MKGSFIMNMDKQFAAKEAGATLGGLGVKRIWKEIEAIYGLETLNSNPATQTDTWSFWESDLFELFVGIHWEENSQPEFNLYSGMPIM